MSSSLGVALVTGASRGIGRAVAVRLAADGWSVAVLARSADGVRTVVEAVTAAGGQAIGVVADVTDEAATGAAVRAVDQDLGPVDLLVNNAGSFSVFGPVWETAPQDWWRDVSINLLGPMNLIGAVVPAMVERGHGRVVNLSSGMGNGAAPYASAYAASKAALTNLTMTLAEELRGTGVGAFVISPGMVQTDMTRFPPEFLRLVPDLADAVERGEWTAVGMVAELVAGIGSGRLDGAEGRYLRATDFWPEIVGLIRNSHDPQARHLALRPYADDDPLA